MANDSQKFPLSKQYRNACVFEYIGHALEFSMYDVYYICYVFIANNIGNTVIAFICYTR